MAEVRARAGLPEHFATESQLGGGLAMTSEELLAQIEATKARVQAERSRSLDLAAEVLDALERQRLRRELEKQQAILDGLEKDNREGAKLQNKH